MTEPKTVPGIWTGQLLHFSCLILLLISTWYLWGYLEKPFPLAFWIAVAFPVVHQLFVWLAWRSELHYSAISNSVGFRTYILIFFFLFGGRFVTLAALGWLDRGSLGLGILPLIIIVFLLSAPGLYAIYSVKRYFGMIRATGADHFDPEYQKRPLVKEGIFRYTDNGMYVYAFLLFWSIAFCFNSTSALVVAAFSHIYIWVHFYATEKPDMEYLYTSE